jgi:hypothetical protein
MIDANPIPAAKRMRRYRKRRRLGLSVQAARVLTNYPPGGRLQGLAPGE